MDNETQEKAPESDWIIARDGGMWLVGKEVLDGDGWRLSPAFELHVQVEQVGANARINYACQPLLLLPSLDRWRLCSSTNTWPVRGQTNERVIRAAIAQAEQMVLSMRAQMSGLQIAQTMPKTTDGRMGPAVGMRR